MNTFNPFFFNVKTMVYIGIIYSYMETDCLTLFKLLEINIIYLVKMNVHWI